MANSLACEWVHPNFTKLLDDIDRWADSSKARSMFVDPRSTAFRMVENEFLVPIEDLAHKPGGITLGEVGSFKGRIKELEAAIEDGSIDNKFAQFFWQTSHHAKKDPSLGSVLKDMQMSGFYTRANDAYDNKSLTGILRDLEEDAVSRSLVEGRAGVVSRAFGKKDALQEFAKLDEKLQEDIFKFTNEKDNAAGERAKETQAEIDRLVNNSYLQVYDDMVYVIENGVKEVIQQKYKKMTKPEQKRIDDRKEVIRMDEKDISKLKMENGEEISVPMARAVGKYIELMDSLYDRLRNGVDAQIKSIIDRIERTEGKVGLERTKAIRESLRSKLMPAYEQGYFPHYTRDLHADFMDGLMPHFEEAHNASNPYVKTHKKTIGEIIDGMGSYVSGHVKSRPGDYEYSKYFINSVSNYIFDVNRFNFAAFMNKHMMKGLTELENTYKKSHNSADGYAKSLADYILDLHKAANGDTNISEGTKAWMRTVLGFEFVSKMGINPRGAARNFTQRLLDYVEWGPIQVKRTQEILDGISLGKHKDVDSFIEAQMKKVGLFYEVPAPQLLETGIQTTASPYKKREWNESEGKYEFRKTTGIERFSKRISWLAGKSSILHRKAENSNRKHTFKIAFAQMYRWLDNKNWVELQYNKIEQDLLEKGKIKEDDPLKKKRGKILSVIKNRRLSKARQYGINMVIMNHFDYADFSKSKMLRHPVGRFLGQFQHFSFEFFEKNLKLLRDAKYDIKEGHYVPSKDARGLQKAYRMGFVYFLAPVLASAVSGVDFTNLVEHDTAQRIRQLAAAFFGDEEEVQRAFYGKGPIISTFGGPITSDIIDIGVMLDLIDLDDENLLTLLVGLENYETPGASRKEYTKIRILNTFLGRATERHIPQLVKGRIGWALQQELGLYPTAEARKIQKRAKRIAKEGIAPEIKRALEAIEAASGL